MNGYFKPLRRKIGVGMLALACVFAAGWVRSYSISDQFNTSLLRHDVFQSASGGLRLFSDGQESNPASSLFSWWSVSTSEWLQDDPEGQAEFDLFDLYEYDDGSMSIVIPYWPIVIPLTLLSAFLLLSKPHKTKKKIVEPIANDGT